ncbi:hypothetical protein [Streptomyces sp. NPDC088725]|uniref:hypothetical protein n=1 Tax=Streptomyces sp. NPDC088725 TaxID=3365873 RepID=UPI0037FB5940
MNETHRQRFTIIGNHLAQHRELSLTAIGLATHIQSLPDGASVDIITLARKFTEGRDRISSALRELEAHGYLERTLDHTPDGRIITRTISYNHPEATRARLAREAAAHSPSQARAKPTSAPTPTRRSPARAASTRPSSAPAASVPSSPAHPSPAPAASTNPASTHPTPDAPIRCQQRSRTVRVSRTTLPTPRPAKRPALSHPPRPNDHGPTATARPTDPVSAPPPWTEAATPEPAPSSPTAPTPTPPRTPSPTPQPTPAPSPTPPPATPAQARPTPPPLPAPQAHHPERHTTAITLLAGLHRDAPQLLLPERDVHRLAPAVAAWLERGATPDAVHHTLTNGLPTEPRHPAALLAHRLTDQLPPPLPTARITARPDPLQNCENCDRAYRAPTPGKCRDCLTQAPPPPA